ncbi:MAG TPA: methyltransferase domain-containing protein [Bryobacteraceae bacterium]|nr:methyltransferase domain-containing protein [Bryobacteraceae bacterium]
MEKLLEQVIRRFRERRMRGFARRFRITPETTILDVGGTSLNWSLLPVTPRIVFLNTDRVVPAPGFQWVIGDGCALPFRDGAFDIAFSNSVIEHVGSPARQAAFAAEIARVGRRYWVQTPNRRFPVEPHLLTPFLHWLPRPLQRWLAPRFTLWSALIRPSLDRRAFYIQHYLNDIRLLSAADLTRLFPGALVIRERLLGLTKSLIATR